MSNQDSKKDIILREIDKTLDTPVNTEILKPKKNRTTLLVVVSVLLILIIAVVYLSISIIPNSLGSTLSNFREQAQSTHDTVSNDIYTKYYTKYREKYYTSSKVDISVGQLSTDPKLQVLAISSIKYDINETPSNIINEIFGGKTKSWLQVPANSVFTVNMQLAEYVIDNDCQYVLVRIPRPELSRFSIDHEKIVLRYFDESGVFKNADRSEVENYNDRLSKIESELYQEVLNNQSYYVMAQDNARKTISNLIKQLNPSYPDLVVDVEFMD